MTALNESSAIDLKGCIDTPSIHLAWSEAPWDTVVFGHPVLQIDRIDVRGPDAAADISLFVKARDRVGCRLVSCRLPHERLRESMLLEDAGFRFIEMLYQPELTNLQAADAFDGNGLSACLANMDDLPEVVEAAGKVYGHERIHMDPRLPSALGDLRYQNWVRSTLTHPAQRLYVLRDAGMLVAFFVTERFADGTCYWHLNGVAPDAQGKGYGLRAWRAMLSLAKEEGANCVRTSIVARNHRVLNLYARLGFNFPPPLMTFHWVRRE